MSHRSCHQGFQLTLFFLMCFCLVVPWTLDPLIFFFLCCCLVLWCCFFSSCVLVWSFHGHSISEPMFLYICTPIRLVLPAVYEILSTLPWIGSGAFSHLYDKYWVCVSCEKLWTWMIIVWAYICCTVAIGQHLLVLPSLLHVERVHHYFQLCIFSEWEVSLWIFSLHSNGDKCSGSPRLSKRDMFMFWPPASWSKSVSVWFWLESVPGISVLKSCGLFCFLCTQCPSSEKLS